jgi:hypothetical protein
MTKTPEGTQEYLDTYVYGTKNYWEYLDKVGGLKQLDAMKAEAIWGY